jgi:hypothetical protein
VGENKMVKKASRTVRRGRMEVRREMMIKRKMRFQAVE